MNNVMTIAGNELRRIFVSPLAWSVLGVVQLILGFVFLMLLIDYANNPQIAMDQYTGVADFIGAGLYGFAVIVLLLNSLWPQPLRRLLELFVPLLLRLDAQ